MGGSFKRKKQRNFADDTINPQLCVHSVNNIFCDDASALSIPCTMNGKQREEKILIEIANIIFLLHRYMIALSRTSSVCVCWEIYLMHVQ